MRVLLVAYPFAAVTPDPVGGAEQVLSQLDRGLTQRGHETVVVAREDSRVAGRLVPIPAVSGPIEMETYYRINPVVSAAVAREASHADIVHMHGFDFGTHLPPPGPPVLATLHLPLDWYIWPHLNPERPLTWLNPVSADQVARAPWMPGHLLPPIPNGIDLDRYRPGRLRGYVLFLGRLCEEKGLETALEAARLAGERMLIVGELYPYPAHQAWFEAKVRPHLGPRARWLGPVTGKAKARLLGAAKAVVVPSLVAETGSLVTMEALASGAPVVGSAHGAIPGLIQEGLNGFLAPKGDAAAFAEGLRKAGGLSRDAVWASARGLSQERTIEAYLRLYEHLIEAARAASAKPSPRRSAPRITAAAAATA